MSSLYGRTAKPFEYKDSLGDDDVVCFQRSNATRKAGSAKRNLEVFLLDSDDDDVTASSKARKSPVKGVVDISKDDDDDYMAQVKAKMKALAGDDSDSDNEVMVLDAATGNTDTKHSRKAKALLKKVTTAANGPTPKKLTKAQAAAAAKAAAVALNSPEIIDLDQGSSYTIPQLDNTVKLPARYVPVSATVDISLDRMQKLAGTSGNATDTSSSSSGVREPAETEKAQCRLKTRLNGNHERKWRIPFDESFGKLRGKFAAVYGLPLASIKFQFDGETVKDSETPQSLDMEDENMVDVTVDKALYVNAVATADRTAASVPPSVMTGSVAPSAPKVVPEAPSLRLRTRLNGSHEWKWKVAMNDTFGKLRQKFSEVYGVPIGEIKFVFDGEVVMDSDTPTTLDMEQDNMIDAKIDKSLYVDAITRVNFKHHEKAV